VIAQGAGATSGRFGGRVALVLGAGSEVILDIQRQSGK